MLEIKFSIEGEAVLHRVGMLATRMSDFTIPLTGSKDLLMSDINQAFSNNGANFGGWAKLSSSYAIWKAKHYGNAGILTRTGKMRKSFVNSINPTSMSIWNTATYFPYHQSNRPRVKIPRRVMLYFTEATKRNILKQFQEYILKVRS